MEKLAIVLRSRFSVLSLITLAALIAAYGSFPILESPPMVPKAALLVTITLILWASGIVSEALATLLFFVGGILFKIAPPEVVLSGLTSSAFWMIFSGLILGAAIRTTGLSNRIAAFLAPLAAEGPIPAIAGATLFGILLAFLMPSAMGRIVLIIPLLQDLNNRLGLGAENRSRRGILLGGILGTALPSTAILPSNVPNNVLAGIYEGLFHQPISYGDYLWQHFPILGALKSLLLVALLAVFYREKSWAPPPSEDEQQPWTPSELRLTAYLAIAVLLWMTDSIHRISPAWVGLGVAILCLAPDIGVVPGKMLQNINVEPLLYVAGVVSLGAVISHTGLGQQLATWLERLLPSVPEGGMGSFLALCTLSTLLGALTTVPGVPAILTPMTEHFATLSLLPHSLVLASQVVGFSTLLFPYQAPPVAAALQLSGISRREMTKVLLALAALSIPLLWPLDYLWLNTVS